MYITDKYIFIHCNKTAGVFVKDFMLENMNAKILKYKHAPIRMLPQKYKNRLTVGCIRNPFEWYLSYFSYHQQNGSFTGLTFEEYLDRACNHSRRLLSLLPRRLMKKHPLLYPPSTKLKIGGYTFHYINYFCKRAIKIFKTGVIKDYSNDLDVVMRVESLRDDMIKTFGFKEKIRAFKKRNTSTHKKYREVYTKKMRQLVEKRDGKLMEYLGYEY